MHFNPNEPAIKAVRTIVSAIYYNLCRQTGGNLLAEWLLICCTVRSVTPVKTSKAFFAEFWEFSLPFFPYISTSGPEGGIFSFLVQLFMSWPIYSIGKHNKIEMDYTIDERFPHSTL